MHVDPSATPDGHRTEPVGDTRASVLSAAADVLANRGRLIGFATTAVMMVIVYTIVLPFGATLTLSFDNWNYLDPGLLAWSVVLGASVAFIIVLQIHAARRLAARRSSVATGGLALLASLLPSMLTCGPLLPAVLAFLGLSASSLSGTTGRSLYFVGTHRTEFLIGSVALLWLAAWWGLRRIARLSGQGTGDDIAVADPAGAARGVDECA